jgi:signal transduction histidine kinase/ActR/RegA family two-component response regulator
MKQLKLRTVRHKLLAVVLITTLAALVAALMAMVGFTLRDYHKSLIADMATQSELLGHITEPALTFDDQRLAEQNLNLLRFHPKVNAAVIYDENGKEFASYNRNGEMSLPQVPEQDLVRVEGSNLMVFRGIHSDGELLGTVFLRANYELAQRMLAYAGIGIGVIGGAMLIALALLVRLQPMVTRPIQEISRVAGDVVANRDYSRRASKTSDDEVGVLVDSFNNMLAEIERRTEQLESSNEAIAHEVHERRLAQGEVMRLNQQLENRVRERTAQLEIANEELTQAKAAAEHANKAKSSFLSRMSHDLRTPLNAILGFTQLLVLKPERLSTEQLTEYTAYILKAGEHLLALVDEVLDLAKIESGAMTLSLEPVALGNLLKECHELIEPLSAQRNINLTIDYENSLLVLADQTRLKQVLVNLLSNAIKYNRNAGSVTVFCSRCENDMVRITVQDTGSGLSEEQVNQLFQPFNRLGRESGQIEGTGIGLVVTKSLVELMNGRIGVNSKVDSGSAFWIELPLAPKARAETRQPGPGRAAAWGSINFLSAPITMLYVEDNPTNLKLIEEILSGYPNIELQSTPDANSGIALARAHQPNLILMDLNLPGMSGSEALEILKNDPSTAHIPVIALTASAMQNEIDRGLALGFFAYITKPVRIRQLFDTIQSAIASTAAG